MTHPFPVKVVALQAGVSVATVDRVLKQRGGVHATTVRRVMQALDELARQSTQVGLAGKKFMLDVVMVAPQRFTDAVRAALEAELPSLHPAVLRSRFHLHETLEVEKIVALLERIRKNGSHGVLLKAPDLPSVAEAVNRLAAAGIPVVTLVTDVPGSARRGYVGMDNRAAGETAAYLIGQWLGEEKKRQKQQVLVTLSSNRFHGEEEREIGFRRALRERHRHLSIVEVSEGHGIDGATGALVRQALVGHTGIAAVYSIGGGNAAIVQAFAQAGRPCRVFIGHDLDADNVALLRSGAIQAVLHHDLGQDMRRACQEILRAQGALPALARPQPLSAIQVVTPWNLPALGAVN
ncbi:LacI family DNA-binding transcriptional regulator [Janthinobacterium sp. 1_2014MBL_MicDiv]|uniref:LacI family DNA-binding transcriptional regulator n=1 Tax=Janthinobacterium sp. 1_2014MBL_MicDiv TaxID=1644131 RepID=UPI0008F4A5B9|nr:LacI family DNA-binding transcriptional regulator [Janthinobacterium sp. 1_2014MBL_MicDiv]APA68235.1 LacI family transcriptional regulator [Janthinobacterium sp. 1_2014MBL_MicDiv]